MKHIINLIVFTAIFLFFASHQNTLEAKFPRWQILAQRTISLETRQPDKWVNDVFKDNILLNIAYMKGSILQNKPINWAEIRKPFLYEFTLKPKEVFAFHEDVYPMYQNKLIKTTQAHFNWSEGFRSDGYLVGDGVCHLASFIYWAAKDAKLEALAPTNHDFAVITEVPRQFGVAIYYMPGNKQLNVSRNLYIVNTKQNPITFKFVYDGIKLKVMVIEKT